MNFKDNKNLTIISLAVVALVFAGLTVYFGALQGNTSSIPKDQAAQKGLDYINNQLLQGQYTANLSGEVTEVKGLYKFEVTVQGQKLSSYITKDGELFFPQGVVLNSGPQVDTGGNNNSNSGNNSGEPTSSGDKTIASFTKTGDEACTEDGKPLVYFFGSESCPHCQWEKPIINSVAGAFGDEISYRFNMDNNRDMDVFSKYSSGGVPTLVLGCKYKRVGSGESIGKQSEEVALTALICDLTNGQPTSVCDEVKEITDQI